MFAELLRGLNLDRYGRAKPAGSWRRGGPGDQDWEMMNGQLLAEWLRFVERMTENMAEQCARLGVGGPPWEWRGAQVRQFRRLLTERYDGQAYPAPEYVSLYEERLTERHGPVAVELFRDKWRQCS